MTNQPQSGQTTSTRTGRTRQAGKPTLTELKARRLDGLVKAIDWSYVVGWQISRLYDAEEIR